MGSYKVYHVGLMKSGTTYIQEILSRSKDLLASQGWHYPGRRLNQQHACYSLCGKDIPWVKSGYPGKLGSDLVRSIRGNSQNLILSAEALSVLNKDAIARFLAKVGRPDKVVFTIRGLGRTLPSAWQQYLKGGGKASFMEFVARLTEQRGKLEGFWTTYAYGHSVQRWSEFAPVEAVILPAARSSDDELWHMFRLSSGLPEIPVQDIPVEKTNVSLSVEAANILRQMNKFLPANSPESDRIRNEYLKNAVFPLSGSKTGSRIGLPKKSVPIIESWNDEEAKLLLKHAAKVYGAAEDLSARAAEMPDGQGKQVNQTASVAAQQILQLLG